MSQWWRFYHPLFSDVRSPTNFKLLMSGGAGVQCRACLSLRPQLLCYVLWAPTLCGHSAWERLLRTIPCSELYR